MFANSTEIKYVNKQSCRLNIIVGKGRRGGKVGGGEGRKKWEQLHKCRAQSVPEMEVGSVDNAQGANAGRECWEGLGYKSHVSLHP